MKTAQKDTRLLILEAAQKAMAEGNTNLSMADIARASGVSKAALYYFYKDKQELFGEAILTIMQSLHNQHAGIMAKKNMSPMAKLRELLVTHLNFCRTENLLGPIVFRQLFSDDKDLLSSLLEKRVELCTMIATLLADAMRAGEIQKTDVSKTMMLFINTLDAFSIEASLDTPPNPITPEELCDHLFALLK